MRFDCTDKMIENQDFLDILKNLGIIIGMKTCVLIDAWFPHIGGGQIHAWELAKDLTDNHKIDVDIITRKHPGEVNNNLLGYKGKLGVVKVIRFSPSLPFENLFGRTIYLIQSLIYLIPKKFDLVHVHAFSPAIPGKIISTIKKIPIIMTIHGTSVEGYKGVNLTLREKFFLEVERILLFKIKYTAEISVSSDLKSIENVNKKIDIIPTGANISQFSNQNVKKDKRFKILFVGRLHRQKGLNYLIQAMKSIIEQHPYVKLVIVGQGGEKDNLVKIANQTIGSNWNRSIEFKTLSQNELIKEYLSASLFVLPSIYEGSPIVLFEAWGAKLPVVTSKVGALPDFIKSGLNGYLVDSKDSSKLGLKICEAINNKELTKMGEEGYKTAKEYSWHNMAEKVFKVYERVQKYG